MAWQQRIVRLAPRSRGFHLITHELEQALTHMEKPSIGLLHLFLQKDVDSPEKLHVLIGT